MGFRGLTGRAVAISATRLMNYGLLLISPMVLVRLLSPEDFGRYREFLVYVTMLAGISGFGINSSLLRFVPDNPRQTWRFVNHAVVMTFFSSLLVTGSALLLNDIMQGRLIEAYAVPIALYVLLQVNLDFWEFLWLAEKRSSAVLRYTTARLVARMLVVITVAAWTEDVTTIVWSLIWLEAVRLAISAFAWLRRPRDTESDEPVSWREQWSYCLPFGAALVVVTLSKSVGPLFIAKMMGPAALAQFVIGTYLQPVISVIRNSLSDVVLPEMASRRSTDKTQRLQLWRSSTVVTAVFLMSAGVVLARFADVLIVTLFSDEYRPAVIVFQIFMLVILRETVDLGIPLRALSRNAPILWGNLISFVLRIALLVIMVPNWGLVGGVGAIVISRFAEGGYLVRQLARAYQLPVRQLLPWIDLLKILAVALVSGVVLLGDFWVEQLGIFAVVPAGCLYLVVFVFLLSRLRIPEVTLLIARLRSTQRLILRGPR
jgi:O-antigen/teichoic acid export membrane protein